MKKLLFALLLYVLVTTPVFTQALYFGVVYDQQSAHDTLYTFSMEDGMLSNEVIDKWPLPLSETVSNGMCRIALSDNYLMLWSDADSDGWLNTINISEEGEIAASAHSYMPLRNTDHEDDGIGASYEGLAVGPDGTIFTANYDAGMYAYTYNGSALTNTADVDDGGRAMDVYVRADGRVFLANGNGGIRAYTYNGSAFAGVGNRDDGGSAEDIAMGPDDTFFLANSTDGLYAYTYDEADFTLEGTVDEGNVTGVAVNSDGVIFSAWFGSGLIVYTFSDPNFTETTRIAPGGSYYEVSLHDSLILLSGSSGLYAYTYANETLSLKGHVYEEIGMVMDATVDSVGTVYYANYNDGLWAYTFDGSDFTLIDNIDDGGTAVGVAIGPSGAIFLANKSDGIRSYEAGAWEWDGVNGTNARVQQVESSDYYLISYSGANSHCWVKTIEVDSAGFVTTVIVDSLEITDFDFIIHKPVYMGNSYYVAIGARDDATDDGYLITFTVNPADGSISDTYSGNLVFSSNSAYVSDFTSLERIGTSKYLFHANATTAPANDWWTFDIDTTDGSASVVSESRGVQSKYGGVCQTQNTGIMFLAFTDATGDGWTKSFAVSTVNGVSNFVTVDDDEFDPTDAVKHMVLQTSNPAYILVSSVCADSDPHIYSFSVGGSGIITNYDNLEYALDTSAGYSEIIELFEPGQPVQAVLSTRYLAIINHGEYFDGTLYTVACETDGTIGNAVIDSWEFEIDISGGLESVSMCRLGATEMYLLVWTDGDSDGQMATVEIDSLGDINDGGATDTYEFDKVSGIYQDVRPVGSSGYYLVTYSLSNASTWLKTYAVSDEGAITKEATDSLQVTTVDWNGEVITLGGNRYILYGTGAGSDGFRATFYINPADGMISDTIEDGGEWHPWNWYGSARGCRVHRDKYHFTMSRGQIKNWYSVEVDTTDGSIDSTPGSGNYTQCYNWQVIKPLSVGDDSVYVMTYQQATTLDGWLRTFIIRSNGIVPNFHAALDSVEFETDQGKHFDIVETSTPGLILVTSSGTSAADGYVRSFIISGAGAITGPIDFLEYDVDYSVGSQIVELFPSGEAAPGIGFGHKVSGADLIPPGRISGVRADSVAAVSKVIKK